MSSRQVRYSAAAAAGAALAGAGIAEAALIVSPNEGFAVTAVSSLNAASVDVDGDGNPDILAGVSASFFYNPGFSSFFSSYTGAVSSGSLFQYNVAYITAGQKLGFAQASNLFGQSSANLNATTTTTSLFTGFPPYGGAGASIVRTFSTFFGFAFFAGSNATATPNLGWLHSIVQFAPGLTRITFDQIVYETVPGQPIHVGERPQSAVPEPSSVGLMGLGLLALGGRGLREWRRRKKKQDA
ncbi:MAG: PEP-CTERM sorting domain-containing protein [Bryobacterales bacterium]|nr:PEP-CTERM sorting domain-containing protein [Bryobacterales bacterium]